MFGVSPLTAASSLPLRVACKFCGEIDSVHVSFDTPASSSLCSLGSTIENSSEQSDCTSSDAEKQFDLSSSGKVELKGCSSGLLFSSAEGNK